MKQTFVDYQSPAPKALPAMNRQKADQLGGISIICAVLLFVSTIAMALLGSAISRSQILGEICEIAVFAVPSIGLLLGISGVVFSRKSGLSWLGIFLNLAVAAAIFGIMVVLTGIGDLARTKG